MSGINRTITQIHSWFKINAGERQLQQDVKSPDLTADSHTGHLHLQPAPTAPRSDVSEQHYRGDKSQLPAFQQPRSQSNPNLAKANQRGGWRASPRPACKHWGKDVRVKTACALTRLLRRSLFCPFLVLAQSEAASAAWKHRFPTTQSAAVHF